METYKVIAEPVKNAESALMEIGLLLCELDPEYRVQIQRKEISAHTSSYTEVVKNKSN